jgi:prophage antirepressor-like protein
METPRAQPSDSSASMDNALSVFNFNGMQVRTVEQNGTPWFVANDVAEILGYSRPRDAVKSHCKCTKLLKGVDSPLLTDSNYGITIIPESDVYRLIMRSKLPSAERFEEWVTSEVLPSIRKTGSYAIAQQPMNPHELIARAVIEANMMRSA